jgi:hypothetical protein
MLMLPAFGSMLYSNKNTRTTRRCLLTKLSRYYSKVVACSCPCLVGFMHQETNISPTYIFIYALDLYTESEEIWIT